MTNNEDIPAEVKQFILTKIDSVPHLEALLLIWEQRFKTWTESELAKALFVELRVARKISNDLLRRGWTKQQPGANDTFLYDASWDPEDNLMRQLAETYRTKLVRVATLIHSNASAAVRDFAKAFDLKKE
jgi:hypothetical protein